MKYLLDYELLFIRFKIIYLGYLNFLVKSLFFQGNVKWALTKIVISTNLNLFSVLVNPCGPKCEAAFREGLYFYVYNTPSINVKLLNMIIFVEKKHTLLVLLIIWIIWMLIIWIDYNLYPSLLICYL